MSIGGNDEVWCARRDLNSRPDALEDLHNEESTTYGMCNEERWFAVRQAESGLQFICMI